MYGCNRPFDPLGISLIAFPAWMQVALKSRNKTLVDLWSQDPQSVWTIFSSNEVKFHDDITMAVETALFGRYSYDSKMPDAVETRKQLKTMWDAIPFDDGQDFVLDPVIYDSNLIALVRRTGKDAEQVADTPIYERLLSCYHKLAAAQHGTQVWDTPLARSILDRIQSTDAVA